MSKKKRSSFKSRSYTLSTGKSFRVKKGNARLLGNTGTEIGKLVVMNQQLFTGSKKNSNEFVTDFYFKNNDLDDAA